MTEPAVTLAEAARRSPKSESTLRRWLQAGKFDGAERPGEGNWSIPVDSLVESGAWTPAAARDSADNKSNLNADRRYTGTVSLPRPRIRGVARAGFASNLIAWFDHHGDLVLRDKLNFDYWYCVPRENVRQALAALLTKRFSTVDQVLKRFERMGWQDQLITATANTDQSFEAEARSPQVVLVSEAGERLAYVKSGVVERLTLMVLRSLFYDGTWTSDSDLSRYLKARGIECDLRHWLND